ncbi:MAG: D-aminoacylase [Candidatus Aminicenantes bacterium]|nr:D-aminoacylase [Candidatus Aminicenantes bacterium]
MEKKSFKGAIISAISLFFILFSLNCSSPKTYSLVIKNGLIIDGSGRKAFSADLAIRGEKIAKIGRLGKFKADQVIDARGLIVSPGFIDVHTHGDRGLLRVSTADNYLRQGVTTIIGGNCGSHPFPLKELFDQLEKTGIAINFGCLVGHNTIREKVMGLKMGEPTPKEMAEMKQLIDQEMRAGGLGFSTGLSYLPGTYSKTQEIIELAQVAAKYGGIYATHLRDQGQKITEAIEEALEVGRRNQMKVQISHIKLADEAVWNQIERISEPIEKARKRGLKVYCDLYPYTATSSGFTSSFPSWVFEGGVEKFVNRLNDPEIYRQVKNYIIERRLTSARGINRCQAILIARSRTRPEYEGKTLEEILKMKGLEPTAEAAADLIIEIEKEGGAQGIFFQMDEADVAKLMKLPYIMIGSDGEIQVFGRGFPHPRSYGTFPRVIAHYVHEKKTISLEEAIRKMTSLPAEAFNLKKRGLLKPGYLADVVVFNSEEFKDEATYPEPHRYPSGLHLVVVNGQIVFHQGEVKPILPGKVLKNQAAISRKEN